MHFSSNHVKICLLLVIRKSQIKTSRRYHFPASKMTMAQQEMNADRSDWGSWELHAIPLQWCRHFEKQLSSFSECFRWSYCYWSAVPLAVMPLKYKMTWTQRPTPALFMKAKWENIKCLCERKKIELCIFTINSMWQSKMKLRKNMSLKKQTKRNT